MNIDLDKRETGGGWIAGNGSQQFSLNLPPTSSGSYTLAQLDDYMHLQRGEFPHQPPVSLQLKARVSTPDMLGTWGFGFWNDPFSVGLGAGGMRRILPVLLNAAWFFYGSPPNHLSLMDGLPSCGFYAQVFRSPRLPSVLSLLGLPALPFLLWPNTARILRKAAQALIDEDAMALDIDVTEWHAFSLGLAKQGVDFSIDGQVVFSTPMLPKGRLGLVVWIDNQYFRFTPEGKIGFGFLGMGTAQSVHIQNLSLSHDLRYE